MDKQSSSPVPPEKSKCIPCKGICQLYKGTQSSIRNTESGTSSRYSARRRSRRKSSLAISSNCSEAGGPDVFRHILGPTPDETILAGLQTVIDMCSPQRTLASTRRSLCFENDVTSIEEIFKSSGDSLSVISVSEAEMCNQISQQTQPTTNGSNNRTSPDNLKTRSTSPPPPVVQNKCSNQRCQSVQTTITVSSSNDYSSCLNERCATSSTGLHLERTRPSTSTCVQTAKTTSSSKCIQACIGRRKKSSVALSSSSNTKSTTSSDSQTFLSSTNTCSWVTSSTESTALSSSIYEARNHEPCNTSICKAKSLCCPSHRKSRSEKVVCTRKLQSENLVHQTKSNPPQKDLRAIYPSKESQPQRKFVTSSEESVSESKGSPTPSRKSETSRSSEESATKSERSSVHSRKSDDSKSSEESVSNAKGSPTHSRKSDASKSSEESVSNAKGSPTHSLKSDISKSSEESVAKAKGSPTRSRKPAASKSSEGSISKSKELPISTQKSEDSKSFKQKSKSESVKRKGSSTSQEIHSSQETSVTQEANSITTLIQSLHQIEDTTVKESKSISSRSHNHRHLKPNQLSKQPVLLEVIEETYEEPHAIEESTNENVFAGKENAFTEIVKESRENKEIQSDQDSDTESNKKMSTAAKVPYYPNFPLEIICSCPNATPIKEGHRQKPAWCTLLRCGPQAFREKMSKRASSSSETSDDASNGNSINNTQMHKDSIEKSEEVQESTKQPEPKVNRYKNQPIYYRHKSGLSVQSNYKFDPADQDNPPGDATAVRYAIARITTFSQYSTFEILKCKLIPSRIPTCTESIFVLRHKPK